MDPFIGEIRMFGGNYAPVDWMFCDGSLLQISEYDALYSLIGTTYGGDGQVTFALPDLRGRIPLHQGQGAGLSPRTLGESSGNESVALVSAQVGTHAHTLSGTNATSTASNPTGQLLATTTTPLTPYSATFTAATMANTAISNAGNSQPHENRMPYLCVNFIIALNGIYPSRP